LTMGRPAADHHARVNHRFHKVEGIGNDFILIDRRATPRAMVEVELTAWSELAPRLCDRRRGIGADGLLIIGAATDPATADATMWVINFDGSRPEMCGNGLRCAAHYLAQPGSTLLLVETDAGIKRCAVHRRSSVAETTVDMGPGRDLGTPDVEAWTRHRFQSVSMGNPHAITFVSPPEDPEVLARTAGPLIEVDRAFPKRTNVEFASIADDATPRIVLWVWERGVGITQACGTGACATACAAAWSGRLPADTPIAIDLPGGRLSIVVPSDRTAGVMMTGPSTVVFEGEIELTLG